MKIFLASDKFQTGRHGGLYNPPRPAAGPAVQRVDWAEQSAGLEGSVHEEDVPKRHPAGADADGAPGKRVIPTFPVMSVWEKLLAGASSSADWHWDSSWRFLWGKLKWDFVPTEKCPRSTVGGRLAAERKRGTGLCTSVCEERHQPGQVGLLFLSSIAIFSFFLSLRFEEKI